MKPIFIYKYEREMQKKSKQFFKIYLKEGENIEHDFVEGSKHHTESQVHLHQFHDGKSSNGLKRKGSLRASLSFINITED